MEQRGELLTGQERVPRNQGEYLVDLAWRTSAPVATVDPCAQLAEQRGWHEPYRYAPATSRGVVFARSTPQGPYEVLSALGSPDWQPGQT